MGDSLDLAAFQYPELPADFTGKIGVKARQFAGLIDEVEWWKIYRGQEPKTAIGATSGLGSRSRRSNISGIEMSAGCCANPTPAAAAIKFS